MKSLRLFASCCLLLILLAACDSATAPGVKTNTPAPAFNLERLDGASVRFPEHYQGKVVIVRFWADWCPFCRSEMTALEPLYRQHRDQGLVILAINVMQPPETVQPFVKELGISYDVLLDRQGEVTRRYQVMALPMTFVVDRSGVIRARILGEATPEVFTKALTAVL